MKTIRLLNILLGIFIVSTFSFFSFNEDIYFTPIFTQNSLGEFEELLEYDKKNLSGLDLSEQDLSYADLENAKMYGTIFEKTNLSYANL